MSTKASKSDQSPRVHDAAAPVALAIETTGRSGSVAIGTIPSSVESEPVRKASRHDDDLMPAIDRLCSRCRIRPNQIQEVRVSIGPGGFTGLRIGMATAKMLALAVPGLAVIAVPATNVLMQNSLRSVQKDFHPGDVAIVITAAKRGTWWAQSFAVIEVKDQDGGVVDLAAAPSGPLASASLVSCVPLDGPEICHVATGARVDVSRFKAMVVEADSRDLTGNFAALVRSGPRRQIIAVPTAFDCWAAGRNLSLQGQFVRPEILLPLYAREPEAKRLWEQKNGN